VLAGLAELALVRPEGMEREASSTLSALLVVAVVVLGTVAPLLTEGRAVRVVAVQVTAETVVAERRGKVFLAVMLPIPLTRRLVVAVLAE